MSVRRGCYTIKPPAGSLPAGPLADGLIGCYLLSEGGGTVARDSARFRADGTISGGVTWSSQTNGPLLAFSGSSGDVTVTRLAALTSLAEHSVLIRVRLDTVPANPGAVCALNIRLDGSNEISVDCINFGTASLRWLTNMGGVQKSATLTPTAGRWYTLGLTNSKSRDEFRSYLDGAPTGAAQTGLGTAAGAPTVAWIGTDAFAERWPGLIDYVYVWDRALSPAAIQSLSLQPFQMFQAMAR